MIYEITLKLTEEQFSKLHLPMDKAKVIFKGECDCIEEKWILAHRDLIEGGVAANYLYNLYYKDFINTEVVTKTKFYEIVRKILDVDTKIIRIGDCSVNCFIKV